MKMFRLAVAFVIILCAVAATAQSDAKASFNTIKSLQGTWTGKDMRGKPFQVVFRTISNGSAVVSEIVRKEDMVSMFHLDGDRLLMTHYCAAGNQPRMAAKTSPDGKTFTFEFVDATNLASSDEGHMQRMVLTVLDENHHTEDWTFVDGGKESRERFDLQR
ncbi:MAG TPA: hypothetical protein VFI95_23235 [Terriglobales bacterium]|nr:hypothetical protein [Terriglobales bacterium]